MRTVIILLGLCAMGAAACEPRSWTPPEPAGMTYQYDSQGYRSTNTTVVAGTTPAVAYGGVFAWRDARGIKAQTDGKDPFVQAMPIDGFHFNDHLATQGTRVTPATPPPSATTASPPSAGATP